MFDLGLSEILILILLIIILFYPQKTKDIVKNLGVAVKAFKEGTKEVEKELKE